MCSHQTIKYFSPVGGAASGKGMSHLVTEGQGQERGHGDRLQHDVRLLETWRRAGMGHPRTFLSRNSYKMTGRMDFISIREKKTKTTQQLQGKARSGVLAPQQRVTP